MKNSFIQDIVTGELRCLTPCGDVLSNPCSIGVQFRSQNLPTLLSAVTISAITAGNPATITTAIAHGLSSGPAFIQGVTGGLLGTYTAAGINGFQTITVTGANTFTIPVNVPVAPMGLRNAQVGPLTPTSINYTLLTAVGGTAIAQATSFTLGPNLIYFGALSLSTSAAIALFASQQAPVVLVGLFDWQQASDASPIEGNPLPFTLSDRGNAGDVPPSVPGLYLNSLNFQSQITGYIGGASNDLDSLATDGLPAGICVSFNASDVGYRIFKRTAGTTASSVSSPYVVVRSADYNASTNAFVWVATI